MIFDARRFDEESEYEYIYRIGSQKELIGSWQHVADILNENLGYEFTESKYRKQIQAFDKLFNANKKKFIENNALITEINDKMRELEKSKTKFRDERNEMMRIIRSQAREETTMDLLEKRIADSCTSRVRLSVNNNKCSLVSSDMLIVLSDWHIGQAFDSYWGKYNSDIAAERVRELCERVVAEQRVRNCSRCHIAVIGDMISGNIHTSLRISNRENVIDQTIKCSELLTEFIGIISEMFDNVDITYVSGNHTRMDKKDDALKDERIDNLIMWYVKSYVKNINNVTFIDPVFDSTLSVLDIRGHKYAVCHGDFDTFTENGSNTIAGMLGYFPDGCIFGHKHTNAYVGNKTELIRGGSLSGTGDDYTVQKRIVGVASQMIAIFNDNGVDCLIPVKFVKTEGQVR